MQAFTGGQSCDSWCAQRKLVCVRAQDNDGVCKLSSNHSRQTDASNGCHQRWSDQICTCALVSADTRTAAQKCQARKQKDACMLGCNAGDKLSCQFMCLAGLRSACNRLRVCRSHDLVLDWSGGFHATAHAIFGSTKARLPHAPSFFSRSIAVADPLSGCSTG